MSYTDLLRTLDEAQTRLLDKVEISIRADEREGIAALGHKLAADLGIPMDEVRLFPALAAREKAVSK